MKILKRNYGHRNLILFLILSLIYLHAIYSLSLGRTLFSLASLNSFFIDHYLILSLTALTAFMVLRFKKYSELMLLLCLSSIVGKNFVLLSDSFNKLTLVFNFIYLLFAFYFFITWELEVGLAAFNPKFSSRDLEKEPRFKIPARIKSSEAEEGGIEAFITNIDQESCFLLLSKNAGNALASADEYYLESIYEDVCFGHKVNLVSSYDRGRGFVFLNSFNDQVSWSELYKVCLERGLVG